jgi:hypothetical protein
MTGAVVKRQSNGGVVQHPDMAPDQVAAAFRASGMFPDLKNEAQALVKIIAGQELGIGPMAAMMGINIIQGKVTLSANLLASQVKSNKTYDYLPREHTAEVCRLEFFQNGESVGISEFTIEDARRAGVAGGQNYRKYPKAMLFARALTQGVRWFCPDVTAGSPAYVPEELGAQVDEEGTPVETPGPVTAEVTEPEQIEAQSQNRSEAEIDALMAAIAPHVGTYGDINDLLGAAGLDGLRAASVKAYRERLGSLTDEEVAALHAELPQPEDDGEEAEGE